MVPATFEPFASGGIAAHLSRRRAIPQEWDPWFASGRKPPNHAAKITAHRRAMASACSKRVINSAAIIATATDKTAIV